MGGGGQLNVWEHCEDCTGRKICILCLFLFGIWDVQYSSEKFWPHKREVGIQNPMNAFTFVSRISKLWRWPGQMPFHRLYINSHGDNDNSLLLAARTKGVGHLDHARICFGIKKKKHVGTTCDVFPRATSCALHKASAYAVWIMWPTRVVIM